MSVLESYTEGKVRKYAIAKGWLVFKLNNPASSGWPDRLFVSPTGVHVYIEFKRQGEELRRLQEHRHEQLRNNGCNVFACDNIEQGMEIIDGTVEST